MNKPVVAICLASRSASPPSDLVESLTRVRNFALGSGVDTFMGIGISGASVDYARNIGVANSLNSDPRPTHLLMVDDDIFMPEGTIPALLECDAGIAGGCYPGMKRVREDVSAPLILVRRDGCWSPGWFDGIVDAEVVPGGCMLIDVDALDTLGFPWFRFPQELKNGVITNMTEDVDFCERAAAAGFSVKAHGGVRCSHMNRLDLSLFVPDHGAPFVPDWTGPTLVEYETVGV